MMRIRYVILFLILVASMAWPVRSAVNDAFYSFLLSDASSAISSKKFSGQEKGTEISIMNFGDAMFDRGVRSAMADGYDPFEFIGKYKFLKAFDFVALNLEGPITENRRCQPKEYSFRFASSTALFLRQNGIDAVNLANNHTFDCYGAGVADTEKYLSEAGVVYFGSTGISGFASEKEIKSKKFAFAGIDLTINAVFKEQYADSVKDLKIKNDFVIVHVHWGIEYAKQPSAEQVAVAHRLIDAGADAVIGHHPHVVQPLEIYRGRPIFYSLGNFIFDQIGKDENFGIGAELIFRGGELSEIGAHPFVIDRHRPKMLKGEEAEIFCSGFLSSYVDRQTSACFLKLAN